MADPVQSSPDTEDAIVFWYKNYKGEEGYRRAVPISIRYGTSDYHHSPQWLMLAFDTEKRAEREFAMSDMSHNCLGGDIKFTLRARSSAGIVEATKLAANMAKILYNGATLDDCPEEQKNAWIAAAQKLMEIYDVRQRDLAQPSRKFPYQQTFDAIAAAVSLYPDKHDPSGISISVRKFEEAFNSHRDAQASSVTSTPRECGLCGGPLPCLTHRQGLPPSPHDISGVDP